MYLLEPMSQGQLSVRLSDAKSAPASDERWPQFAPVLGPFLLDSRGTWPALDAAASLHTGRLASLRNLSRRLFVIVRATMSEAIQQIVDAYVRLNNRRALEDLRMHRQRMAVDLKSRTGFYLSLPIRQIDEEIAVIEAGFERLNSTPSA
jgi:hypothetical protein